MSQHIPPYYYAYTITTVLPIIILLMDFVSIVAINRLHVFQPCIFVRAAYQLKSAILYGKNVMSKMVSLSLSISLRRFFCVGFSSLVFFGGSD